MRVLVTGASGLIGSAVVAALAGRGDHVVALSRDPAKHRWPAGVEALAWDARSALPAVAADAAVNLAGEPVVGRRWTPAQRQRLRDSRLVATRRVVEWANGQRRPPALVSASASGYYGAKPEGPCRETRPPGEDFLARLVRDWEAEAAAAKGRLVVVRLGHVLSTRGGYLGQLLPFARRHLAGPIGDGRQAMAWVHIADVVGAVLWALDHDVSGPFNLVSPGAAGGDQRAFAGELGRVLGKPWQAPVPVLALHVRFGSGAGPIVAGGQDLRSDGLVAQGFAFRHRQLGPALQDLLSSGA
jgi:uncharacterized protein